jgi:hypothetical protein
MNIRSGLQAAVLLWVFVWIQMAIGVVNLIAPITGVHVE